jgi:hypothetical protein
MRIPEGCPTLGDIKHVPRHFYKFRHFGDGGRHLEIITKNEVFFASPAGFNDPFDCHIPADYSSATQDQMQSIYEEAIRAHKPEMRERDIRAWAAAGVRSGTHKDRADTVEKFAAVIDHDLGVFCLSEKPDSLLSWAHYASSHSGFCIGFSAEKLMQKTMEDFQVNGILMPLGRVEYKKAYPLNNRFQMTDQEQLRRAFFIKSYDWQYEQEFRFLSLDHANMSLTLPPESIERVYLGASINPENSKLIIKLLREHQPKANIHQAHPHPSKFELEFEPIIKP